MQQNINTYPTGNPEAHWQERMRTAEGQLRQGLSQRFAAANEIWVVGHKGDMPDNLRAMGILPRNREISVAHVHSSLGLKPRYNIAPPESGSDSYEGLLVQANPELDQHVRRVKETNSNVIALMPFPNAQFSEMITSNGAEANFVSTAPEPDYQDFVNIESKRTFTTILEEVIGPTMPNNIVPHIYPEPGMNLADMRAAMGAEDRPIYLQVYLSAGGDGTVRVENEAELAAIKKDPHWASAFAKGEIKAGMGIVGRDKEGRNTAPYPANGTGCIVPMPDGSCRIFMDGLSHKPVGLPELNAKQGAGVGNDWTEPFPRELQEQYMQMVQMIGEHLYHSYGYTGIFGPDTVIGYGVDNKLRVFPTETNVRWQGTTPYQTGNAAMNGRIPLEVLHYAAKLLPPEELARILPEPEEYNRRSVQESGGYYLKVGSKQKGVAQMDVNGPWLFDRSNGIFRPWGERPRTSSMDVYMHARDPQHWQDLPRGHVPVWLKGPGKGTTVGGGLTPFGYITGSGMRIFEAQEPRPTQEAMMMYRQYNEMVFSGREP